MKPEQEIRYNKLLDKAAIQSLHPSEERELRDFSNRRLAELKEKKRPIYKWDYPIKNRE